MISFKDLKKEQESKFKNNVEYLKIPKGTSKVLRIVPKSIRVEESPFNENYQYPSGEGFLYSPNSWGKDDPIHDLSKELMNHPDHWVKGKLIQPSLQTTVGVIDRDENPPKLRLWSLGKITYENLIDSLIEKEGEINPICPIEGFDILVRRDWNGHNKIKVLDERCPLSENRNEMISLIHENSKVMDKFQQLEPEVWNEITESIISKIQSDDVTENTVSSSIYEVSQSI